MNATRPALPEPTLATWSRTAQPVRLRPSWPSPRPTSAADPTDDSDNTDRVDDLMFGCSAAVLLALPLILVTATLVR